jgi:hypothetical protein
MDEKLKAICKILDVPTHGIGMTDEVDENGAPVCVPYEREDADVLVQIINILLKKLNQDTDWRTNK